LLRSSGTLQLNQRKNETGEKIMQDELAKHHRHKNIDGINQPHIGEEEGLHQTDETSQQAEEFPKDERNIP